MKPKTKKLEIDSSQWYEPLSSARIETLKAALNKSGGNITVAAEELQIARQYMTKLLKQFELQVFARKLRLGNGSKGRALGRPPKILGKD